MVLQIELLTGPIINLGEEGGRKGEEDEVDSWGRFILGKEEDMHIFMFKCHLTVGNDCNFFQILLFC